MYVNYLPAIYFLHIPKTAGTSFRIWLESKIPPGRNIEAWHLVDLDALPDATIVNGRLAAGHFGWRFMERAGALGVSYEPITFLRDPVELALSGMKYASTVQDVDLAALPAEVRQQSMVAVDVARSGRLCGELAAMAQAPMPVDGHLGDIPAEYQPFLNLQTRFLSQNGTEAVELPPLSIADLNTAKRRLEGMRFFGLVEEMDYSAVLFAAAFGLPLESMGERLNVSETPAAMFPEQMRRWQELAHPLDVKLYRFARELFWSRIRKLAEELGLPHDATPGKFAEGLSESFVKIDRGVMRLSAGQLAMDEDILTPGFNRPEFFEPQRRWIRWSGPATRSSVFLPLLRSGPLRVEFEIALTTTLMVRDQMSLQTSGEMTVDTLFRQLPNGDWVLVKSALLPAEAAFSDNQYTEFRFDVPEMTTLKTSQKVSFALGEIRISPVLIE